MLDRLLQALQNFAPGPLADLLETGGPVVIVLLVLSVFVTATIILKLLQFAWLGVGRRGRTDRAVALWLSGRLADGYALVQGRRNPVDKTLAHLMRGIERASPEDSKVREDIERIALKELDGLRSHFRTIEAAVQVAPLLGLFGTVIGMIDAFRTLQNAGAEADPTVLAGGIWVALLTTAVGLAVAIPASLFLYWFEGIAEGEHHRMRGALMSLITGRVTEAGARAGGAPGVIDLSNEAADHAA